MMKIILILFIYLNLFWNTFTNEITNTTVNTQKDVLRIVSGTPAKPGEIFYQVSFKTRREGAFLNFCGGTIIGPNKILSAAHCFVTRNNFFLSIFKGRFTSKSLRSIWVVAGTLKNMFLFKPSADSTEDGQWRRLENLTFPYNYYFPKSDIAILFITKPWQFDTHVASIAYASKFIDYVGLGKISGFGRIGNKTIASTLLVGNAILLNNKECTKKHARNMKMFICTSTLMSDIGKGDSGGPIVCSQTKDPNEKNGMLLVGIVSGKRGSKPFYTRVSEFYQYIENNRGETYYSNMFLLCLIKVTFNFLIAIV